LELRQKLEPIITVLLSDIRIRKSDKRKKRWEEKILKSNRFALVFFFLFSTQASEIYRRLKYGQVGPLMEKTFLDKKFLVFLIG